jgi:hypothetical protein
MPLCGTTPYEKEGDAGRSRHHGTRPLGDGAPSYLIHTHVKSNGQIIFERATGLRLPQYLRGLL